MIKIKKHRLLIVATALTIIGTLGINFVNADNQDEKVEISENNENFTKDSNDTDSDIESEINDVVNNTDPDEKLNDKSDDKPDDKPDEKEDIAKKEFENKFIDKANKNKETENIKNYLNIGSHYFEYDYKSDDKRKLKLEFETDSSIELFNIRVVDNKGNKIELNDDNEFMLENKGIYRVEYNFGIKALRESIIKSKVLENDKEVLIDNFKVNSNMIENIRKYLKQDIEEKIEKKEKQDKEEEKLPDTRAVM